MSEMKDRWLSVGEIGEYLGVSSDTVYRWISTRSMPAHRMPLYIRAESGNGNGGSVGDEPVSLTQAIADWQKSSEALRKSMPGGRYEWPQTRLEDGEIW